MWAACVLVLLVAVVTDPQGKGMNFVSSLLQTKRKNEVRL